MKKNFLFCFIASFAFLLPHAQSKVFKEVSNEISSQIQAIKQDNALVGYLVFTKLEAVSGDSFNYRITIMDENLNDIGKVNFKDENLMLQAVAFDQDVLCMAYLKSNFISKSFKKKKDFTEASAGARHAIVTQFLNLNGETIKKNDLGVDIETSVYYPGISIGGRLDQAVQLTNISQKGFACFYGDVDENHLIAYDVRGKEIWRKSIAKVSKEFGMLSSSDAVYLLAHKDQSQGNYEVFTYPYTDTVTYDKYVLKDKKGNSLKVLGFDIDRISGTPYITGTIINPNRDYAPYTFNDINKLHYIGVYSIQLNGPRKSSIKENFSYWNNNEVDFISSKRGKYIEQKSYAMLSQSFKDYNNNTYFAGSFYNRRPKWGSIISSIVFAPLLVVSPVILMVGGVSKTKATDAMILKQDANGKLTFENTITCDGGSFTPSKYGISSGKDFYRVTNATTKTDYLIVDEIKDIIIYNVTQKKVVKRIPHKDGKIRTNIYPAKEGHMMITEYNKKEKYTRVSIEAL